MEELRQLEPIDGLMQFIERESSNQRLWSWFHARIFDSSGGYRQGVPAPGHCIIMQVGDAMNSSCRWGTLVSRRRATAGDIDIIPMGTSAIWEEDGPSTMLAVSLTPALLGVAARGTDLNPDAVSVEPRLQVRDPLIEHVGWALKAELESNEPYDRIYAEGLGIALAVHLLRRYGRGIFGTPKRGLTRRQLHNVIDYINGNLQKNLSLAEVAAIAGGSMSHFKVLFKQSVGLPVHKYIVQQRVKHAMGLLSRGNTKLSEVALQAGFADQSHMARCMRRVIGMTPAAVIRSSG